MMKANDRNHMPGYEVKECQETIKRLMRDVADTANSIYSSVMSTNVSDTDEWDWGNAGMLSAALCSLKDVCRLLKIDN